MPTDEKVVLLRRGRAKPLWRGHPWVYRDSIERTGGEPAAGDQVRVCDARGKTIGCGFFSPASIIAVRLLDGAGHIADERALFVERLERAGRLRTELLQLPIMTDAYRVVFSEGDFLPGLVADRFGDHFVVQLATAGMDRRRELVWDTIEEVFSPASIHFRPDRRACALEGIEPRAGGLVRGRAPQEPPSILEHGVCFRVDPGRGQKTGFYCDQRYNRHLIGRLVLNKSVLDLHTYTGGFGLYAAVHGASEVTCVDSSGPALALAAENAMLNNCRRVKLLRADARALLNDLHRQGRRFDVVISDPPRFAANREQVPKALRAYRDLHLRAMRVVEPGGLLAASSCSGSVSEEQFLATLREAATDLKRDLQVIYRGGQAPDHPVQAHCPEGRYLKFLLLSVY